MVEGKIAAHIEDNGDDGIIVRSPCVGIVDSVPEVGIYLNALEAILSLRVLRDRRPVLLPRGVQGRVVEQFISGRHVAVEYNQPLFRIKAGAEVTELEHRAPGGGAGEVAEDRHLIAVRAPTDGIFYRRATPDSPPYVEVGQVVARGCVLGLVEVMKSFNQILYGGAGLPERGAVATIMVENAAEVKFGQPLFHIRPEA